MSRDVLLLVPFEPTTGGAIDAATRRTGGARLFIPLLRAIAEFEEFIGRKLDVFQSDDRPVFGGEPLDVPGHRSLTAVTLVTHLERAGLSWAAIDPGIRELDYWRRELGRHRRLNPRVVAVSTTFMMSVPWFETLLAIIRQIFPEATLAIGGYYYATDARQFLAFDADVYCVGEGEVRLPQIIGHIKEGRSLETIPGLYLRSGNGLHDTGRPEQLDLAAIGPPDWSLAPRITPTVDLAHDHIEVGLETQRGCVFKCAFCTYRTLASPNLLTPDQAVDRFFTTTVAGRAYINLIDATATFPHDRWEAILERLIARGGSPHPIWAFARVSDITERTADLMARAGVRQLFIGQESGDQRMLNLMKKGTHISQVRPALDALGRHGITVNLGMIHGFPGETTESIQASRDMLCHANDGFEDNPVVFSYSLGPFNLLDFASVAQDPMVRQEFRHFLAYNSPDFPPERVCEECLATAVAVSKVPHAPCWYMMLGNLPTTFGISICGHERHAEIFRWLKAVERGITTFIERDLDGTPPNLTELRRLRAMTLERYTPQPRWRSAVASAAARGRAQFYNRMGREWTREAEDGVGLTTRVSLAGFAMRDTGKLRSAIATFRTGAYPRSATPGDVPADRDCAGRLADELVGGAVARATTARLPLVKREAV